MHHPHCVSHPITRWRKKNTTRSMELKTSCQVGVENKYNHPMTCEGPLDYPLNPTRSVKSPLKKLPCTTPNSMRNHDFPYDPWCFIKSMNGPVKEDYNLLSHGSFILFPLSYAVKLCYFMPKLHLSTHSKRYNQVRNNLGP